MRPRRQQHSIDQLPQRIPIFPLARALVLPGLQLPLNIFEPRYLTMVDDCLAQDRVIGMIQPHAGQPDDMAALIASGDDRPELYQVGCLARLVSFRETSDGRYLIALDGLCRFRVAMELPVTTPYRQVQAQYQEFADDMRPVEPMITDRGLLLRHLKLYLAHQKLAADWKAIEAAATEALVNSLTLSCPFEISEKQALLEAPTLTDRAGILLTLIQMASSGSSDPNDTSVQ